MNRSLTSSRGREGARLAACWALGLWLGLSALPGKAGQESAKAQHWAFKPPVSRPVPSVRLASWPLNPIDRFILAAMEGRGVVPSPDADRRAFLRRVTFDLTGLPPTPTEIAQFLADETPEAYENVADRLLASPHYGERSARNWLDTVGYADSNGYFDADTDRPLAWKYRDYIVNAFNQNKPFDRFILEQLAGDELAGFAPEGDVTGEMGDLLTATHLLRNAPDGTGESDGNPQELRADRYAVLEGNVQIIGSVFLGLTVQCARCHDHKFEPVSQAEYYQLQAILKPVYNHDRWVKPSDRIVTVGRREERERNRRLLEQHRGELKALKESEEGLVQPLRKLVVQENLAELPQEVRERINKALETKEKERDEPMKSLLKEHDSKIQVKEEQVIGRFPQLQEAIEQVKMLIRTQEKNAPAPLPQISAVTEVTPNPPEHHVLKRGDYGSPLNTVEPGVPKVLSAENCVYRVVPPPNGNSSGRRLAFARWITSPDHPVFARLTVNRIWQGHFLSGLVRTSDNFGLTGAKPTHAELLDYLAMEFIRSGWDVKRLHRLIVLSHTYRQAAGFREAPYREDPEDLLLWRYPLRRLDAESIRDAMLSLSGELDPKLGGPYISCRRNEQGQVIAEDSTASLRRSLYLQQRRTALPAALEVFDYPQMNPNCSRRNSSTVSLQSLYLLNSEFVRGRSAAMALRLQREAKGGEEQKVHYAFELAYGRLPGAEEQAAAADFLQQESALYPSEPGKAWTDFCQMLLGSNRFLYVE